MELGFSPDEAAAASDGVMQAVGPALWLMVILAVGMVGRMIFVAWGDKMKMPGILENITGGRLVALAVAVAIGSVFFADREVRAMIIVQKNVVDPFVTQVLQRDSCNPESDRFCVVVWDHTGREMVVNWHDKRVNAFEVFNDFDFSLFESVRPVSRPADKTTAYSQAQNATYVITE